MFSETQILEIPQIVSKTVDYTRVIYQNLIYLLTYFNSRKKKKVKY